MKTTSGRNFTAVRIVCSVIGLAVCVLLILIAGRFGFARLLERYSLVTKSIPAAAQAVRLSPADADAHRALAQTFQNLQLYREAEREFALAASLRPKDDFLWLDLGTVRDQLEDSNGALNAFDQAVARAPYYAHTHWQRGNVRLRLGRYDEAFAELREAAKSNRVFLPTLLDLAWALSNGDLNTTQQLAGISSSYERVALTRFLAQRGKGRETLDLYRESAKDFSEDQHREIVRELMASHNYPEAYAIWRTDHSASPTEINDGGFEGPINFDDIGFGWIVSHDLAKVEISQDATAKDSGLRSLRVAYNGDLRTKESTLSQTILVKPLQHYKINFAVKAKQILSGGLAILAVKDARTSTAISQSQPLQQDIDLWQHQSFEITTPADCDAVILQLVRKECSSNPCPIFGVLWLDSFSIEEIKQ